MRNKKRPFVTDEKTFNQRKCINCSTYSKLRCVYCIRIYKSIQRFLCYQSYKTEINYISTIIRLYNIQIGVLV